MTAVTARPNPDHQPTETPEGTQPGPTRWLQRPRWNRFTPLQLLVMALATISPLTIVVVIGAALLGVMSDETMREVALAAGEDPGMVTFGAMFLVSPVQWLTGRSQVRVRKYLGIVFFALAFSNGAMFVLEEGLGSILREPLLIAGTIAVALATPLFLTSSRWSQRKMGMKNWRLLHRLTYPVAAALLAHVVFIGDLGPGALLIIVGFIARIPAIRRKLTTSSGRIRPAR
ncbi:MAG: ferric reductase-like transmembrane domain-containing protein [Acidimicrobiales bacterium]